MISALLYAFPIYFHTMMRPKLSPLLLLNIIKTACAIDGLDNLSYRRRRAIMTVLSSTQPKTLPVLCFNPVDLL